MTKQTSGPKKKQGRKTTKRSLTKEPIVYTHNGHKLTPKEDKFISCYVETGNGQQSVIEAGYVTKNPRGYAQTLLTKTYVADEIAHRLEEFKKSKIATAEEVMQYFASVMRGEIKDQFGLDAPLSERTRAAQEIAKRTIDIENRIAGKADAEVKITLNWNRGDEE